MPADRFFIDAELKSGASLLLQGPEHHHLAHVMRKTPGDEVEIVNGRGDIGFGKVIEVGKKNGSIYLLSASHENRDPFPFLLAVPFMRPSKLEWIIEKGTELGADGFYLYPAKYSEKEDLSLRHRERFHLLAIGALKQSGRLYLPSIEIISGLKNLFIKEALFLFGDIRVEQKIDLSQIRRATTVFLTGPEKGFSDEELSILEKHAIGVCLSRYILRAETAPIAAASILGAYSKY